MTLNEKKSELAKYIQFNRDIDKLIEYKAKLRSSCTKVTPCLSGMPGGGGRSKDELYAELLDVEKEIDTMIDKLCLARGVLARNLPLMDTEAQRVLLRERYINFRGWHSIAKMLHTSPNYIRHGLNDQVVRKIQYLVFMLDKYHQM